MNEDELGQVDESGSGDELDEETMQLIAQLLQEGYTEDEIVEAIISAEEGGEEEEPVPKGDMEFLGEMDKLKSFGKSDNDDEEEEPAPKGDMKSLSDKKKPKSKKKDEGYAKGGYVKKPANRLASVIGSLGRFN
jgi:hypothetical protein